MLRVAPDASAPDRTLDELYPGGFLVVDWELCAYCDQEVDGYIYAAGVGKGLCNTHYALVKASINAE
jgi:hypothetical protein